MSVTKKLKALMSFSNVRSVDLAEPLGISYNAAANRLYRGVKSIDDLIKICNHCGASLTITTKDGVNIPLTIDDIDD